MAAGSNIDCIYSATYSGVPVFEFNIEGEHVMRRRQDDYINATHILKVAGLDKPARTRQLEREVQKGIHEKVQGGYGKYQGTWVPLREGRRLAQKNDVLDKLLPLFDYIAGDISPPPAPKHSTNSNKPRTTKPPVKKTPINRAYSQMSEDLDNISNRLHDDDSLDNSTIVSESPMDEEDTYGGVHHPYGAPPSRKRKRGQESAANVEHRYYADQLLDYFILSASEKGYEVSPPRMPDHFQVDRPIDDHEHTALHWACSMGDLDLVQTLLNRGAHLFVRNKRGETPIIRAVLFTNNYEKAILPRLLPLLMPTMTTPDHYDATVLHHIAMSTSSLVKKKCARYYFDAILGKAYETFNPQDFMEFVNHTDQNGDTALHILARHNAKNCVRMLQGCGARGDVFNHAGTTADQMIRKNRSFRQDLLSSSPAPPLNGTTNALEPGTSVKANGVSPYHSQSAQSFSQSFDSIAQDKGLQVALAYDREIRGKDDDLSESQQLQQQIETDRHQVRQSNLRHLGEDLNGFNEDDSLRKHEEERRLIIENKSISEQKQHKDLHQAVRTEEHNLPSSAHQKSNGVILDETEIDRQCLAAYSLAQEQNKRRKFTTTEAAAQSAAGMGQNGGQLKTIVSQVCDIPEPEVPSLTPDLLEELQQSKTVLGEELVV